MVCDYEGQELGPIHSREGKTEWHFEFCFNLADLHLGRFEVKAIQQAVAQAVAEAFGGSVAVFLASRPYSATFAMAPESGGSIDLHNRIPTFGRRLGVLLKTAERLSKPSS